MPQTYCNIDQQCHQQYSVSFENYVLILCYLCLFTHIKHSSIYQYTGSINSNLTCVELTGLAPGRSELQ